MRDFTLYDVAKRADDVFQAELIRVYGVKKACEKRYQSADYHEPSVNAARDAKLAADLAWFNEMQRTPV